MTQRPLAAGRRLLLKASDRARRVHAWAGKRIREQLHADDAHVPLEQVQRRLELLVAALYGRTIPIAAVSTDGWSRDRMRQLASRDPRAREPAPGVDGETIFLPAELDACMGDVNAIARYRLFAIEQAERIVRGTAVLAPRDDALERDLYLIREGTTLDAHIAFTQPGFATTLAEERKSVLARRPKLERLTQAEREVELLVREALSARIDGDARVSIDPSTSLAWARDTARRIRAESASGAVYRGLPPASIWGTVRLSDTAGEEHVEATPKRISIGRGEPNLQQSRDGEAGGDADRDTGDANRSDARSERTNHNASSRTNPSPSDARVNDEPGAFPAGRAEDPTQSPDGWGKAAESRSSENGDENSLEELPPPIWYHEWHAGRRAYVKRAAAVRISPSDEGDARWANDTLRRHAAIVRQVRHQFERLRARRLLLRRQRGGDELDLDACVGAMIDRRVGRSPDDRLYMDARPARRGIAIAFLADVSGSTETRITSALRIIDIEKIALLLAAEALDALGDSYAMYSFAGKTSTNVKMTTIKDFNGRNDEAARCRIAALRPDGFTRLGAALRHTAHQLVRQSAGHRLLLILSDGRPNDLDQYQSQYGVEDSRQAIFEARASGIHPFCLTVDRDASEYLPRIFGRGGHTIVQRPEQLPAALLGAVRALITRS